MKPPSFKYLYKRVKGERGSATIEFLGIVPLAIILLVIIWQMIVGVHGIIVAQSAANEAAKVYSVTEDSNEANSAANTIISTASGYLKLSSSTINLNNTREFESRVSIKIDLVFLPKKLFNGHTPSVGYETVVSGRVIK